MKILIVDDEMHSRRMLKHVLESSNHVVVEARNGGEAVSQALLERPDAILMDIVMPVMDGCQAAEQLRANARTANLPIIACTGFPRPENEWRGLFDAVIEKPFSAAAVLYELSKCPVYRP